MIRPREDDVTRIALPPSAFPFLAMPTSFSANRSRVNKKIVDVGLVLC
jgi:hypothetical protein